MRVVAHGVSQEIFPKTVTIAGIEFDDIAYDRGADVLYLSAGKPRAASDFDASPGGHYLRYDAKGALIGLTIVDARRIFEREGSIPIMLPEHQVELTHLGAVPPPRNAGSRPPPSRTLARRGVVLPGGPGPDPLREGRRTRRAP